ncbi:PREDICTED: receptor-like serine/threonine-protein kinase NCRK isoform X6 [Lupinus angustifolius]|uniref:receptor-like serine/threonine-protein kinase NCRK isoform X6 n=1 Tax=Lupinus angustifolius TaxID=3871 RepID=UPI00092F600D|nr:PREDICTED: receptor-like serine/threonine-protein kinase NCRK isoform X6 [Lupinus angustifolius]
MKLQLKFAFAFVISLHCIQHSFCDKPSNTSALSKWKCRCSSFQGNQSYSLANCSRSCDCHPDAEESASIWTCICDPDGFPEVAADGHSPKCFTACNCSWGTVSMPIGSKKQIPSKIVVVILLICVLCTTLAFLISVIFYVYRRDRCPIRSPSSSSGKETSSGSTTNLISHRTAASSVPETRVTTNSPICHIIGCFPKGSFMFGSRKETFHGNIIQFSFDVLENATENFSASNLIGLGGSSFVYRGRLKDGSDVAVKRLKDQGGPDADSAFFKEIELLSRLHHCHLVHLLGYCSELKGKLVQRLLVFEYVTRGNLRDCLDGVAGNNLDWATRVTIAIGAARGLEYLHEAADPRILHRDVKSSNILLGENWHAKAVPRLQDRRRVITELIDPKLNGNFPEEEVQIMAYLARECLLLDPDTRPTMSEVVQILSSISPGKSRRRRNISASLFREQEDAAKQRHALSHSSLTLDIDHKNKEADGHEDNIMLLTSKTKRWQTSEEEMVDLTEPRFESFCIANVHSP